MEKPKVAVGVCEWQLMWNFLGVLSLDMLSRLV